MFCFFVALCVNKPSRFVWSLLCVYLKHYDDCLGRKWRHSLGLSGIGPSSSPPHCFEKWSYKEEGIQWPDNDRKM